jgi:hypothetical protein
MMILVVLLLCILGMNAFAPVRHVLTGLRDSGLRMCLVTEGFPNCKLTQTDYTSTKAANLFEYELSATISKKEMNSYLDQYKEEMRSRKVVFPGFRPGKLPPYVMPDVRKYLVSFGLETIFSGLGNLNGLQYVTEDGEDVPFGEDEYYSQIIQKDFREYDFEQQRDAWREGTDLAFTAKFFAIKDIEEEGDGEKEESESRNENIIDAEVVDAE